MVADFAVVVPAISNDASVDITTHNTACPKLPGSLKGRAPSHTSVLILRLEGEHKRNAETSRLRNLQARLLEPHDLLSGPTGCPRQHLAPVGDVSSESIKETVSSVPLFLRRTGTQRLHDDITGFLGGEVGSPGERAIRLGLLGLAQPDHDAATHQRGCICEAGRVFDRMLWFNPSGNQGVRFLIDDIRTKTAWEERTAE